MTAPTSAPLYLAQIRMVASRGLALAGARRVARQREGGQALGEGPTRDSSLVYSNEKGSTLPWLRVDDVYKVLYTCSDKTWPSYGAE